MNGSFFPNRLLSNGGYDPGHRHDADIFVLVPPNPTQPNPRATRHHKDVGLRPHSMLLQTSTPIEVLVPYVLVFLVLPQSRFPVWGGKMNCHEVFILDPKDTKVNKFTFDRWLSKYIWKSPIIVTQLDDLCHYYLDLCSDHHPDIRGT